MRPAQLHHIAGEGTDLLLGQLHHSPPGGTQQAEDLIPLHRVRNQVGSDDGERLPHAHHHIGVVDRTAGGVHGVEEDREQPELTAEPGEQVCGQALRTAPVGHLLLMVDHHSAGTFQELTIELSRGPVQNLSHGEVIAQLIDDVLAPFVPAVRRIHRAQDDAAVRVRGEPIIREYAVGALTGGVLEQGDRDALLPQGFGQPRDVAIGSMGCAGVVDGITLLERIICSSGRVHREPVWSDHHHVRRRLNGTGTRLLRRHHQLCTHHSAHRLQRIDQGEQVFGILWVRDQINLGFQLGAGGGIAQVAQC